MGVAAAGAPVLLLGAALGLAYGLLAVRSLAAAFAIFAVLTFFDISPIDVLTRLAGAVLVMLWLLVVLTRGNRVPLIFRDQPRFGASVLALAGWLAGSSIWATDFDAAMTDAVRLLQGILLIVVVYTAVREPRHVRWLMIGFITGAFVSALLGLTSSAGRITGGFDDPNELAAVIVPGAVLASFGFMACRGRRVRWAFLAVLPVFALALFDTDSQGGLVALTVGGATAIALAGPLRVHATLLMTVAACLVLTFYAAKPPSPGQFTEGGAARGDMWKVALHVTRDHPLLGVGAGNFPVVEPSYALADISLKRADLVAKREVVHNTYIHVLVEYGAIGLLLFLSVIASALLLALQAARAFRRQGNRELELLARGQVIATIAMLSAYFFQSGQFEKQLWLMLGLSAALRAVAIETAARRSRAPDLEHARLEPWRREAIAGRASAASRA